VKHSAQSHLNDCHSAQCRSTYDFDFCQKCFIWLVFSLQSHFIAGLIISKLLDGTRAPPLVLLILRLPGNEFDKVKIWRTQYLWNVPGANTLAHLATASVRKKKVWKPCHLVILVKINVWLLQKFSQAQILYLILPQHQWRRKKGLKPCHLVKITVWLLQKLNTPPYLATASVTKKKAL